MKKLSSKISQVGFAFTGTLGRLISSLSVDFLLEWITHQVVANKNSRLVPRTRKNLSIITQLPKDDPKIEKWLRTMCRNMLHGYLDYFRGLRQGKEFFLEKVDLDRQSLLQIYQVLATGRGVVLAGTHTCGYDHCIQVLAHYLPSIQILSKANPTGGKKLMYLLRKRNHIDITPLSVSSLRKAYLRLKSGGIVAVAIDIPVSNGDRFQFFNQTTPLTNAHTRLAVQSEAELFLVYSRRTANGKYRIEFQAVPQPKNCQHKKALITAWAQESFRQIEPFIKRWPEAWYGSTFDIFPGNEINPTLNWQRSAS